MEAQAYPVVRAAAEWASWAGEVGERRKKEAASRESR